MPTEFASVSGTILLLRIEKLGFECELNCSCFNHLFYSQPRNIIFDTATEVKVGRSITRTKIADNNAVFDCKVLSRNHAVIWYRDGKFFLRVSSFIQTQPNQFYQSLIAGHRQQ